MQNLVTVWLVVVHVVAFLSPLLHQLTRMDRGRHAVAAETYRQQRDKNAKRAADLEREVNRLMKKTKSKK